MDGDDGHSDGPKFRVLISTKRLLNTSLKSNSINADATYKLVCEGMPVLIFGTTDQDRHFHPFGIQVSSNEKIEDFKFLFQTLKDEVTKLTGSNESAHKTLMSDASDSI